MSAPARRRRNRSLVVGFAVAGAALALGFTGILWASSIYDAHGKPLLDAPAASVMVVILAPIAGAVAAVIVKIGGVERQVANDHVDDDGNPILLRDDNDQKHEETKTWIDELRDELRAEIRDGMKQIHGELGGIRRDVGRASDADQAGRQELAQLRKEFAAHVDWSQQQAGRIDGLEKGTS